MMTPTYYCQALKKSGRICGLSAIYLVEGYVLCSRHKTRYEKMKVVKVRYQGRTTKIQKEVEDEE